MDGMLAKTSASLSLSIFRITTMFKFSDSGPCVLITHSLLDTQKTCGIQARLMRRSHQKDTFSPSSLSQQALSFIANHLLEYEDHYAYILQRLVYKPLFAPLSGNYKTPAINSSLNVRNFLVMHFLSTR